MDDRNFENVSTLTQGDPNDIEDYTGDIEDEESHSDDDSVDYYSAKQEISDGEDVSLTVNLKYERRSIEASSDELHPNPPENDGSIRDNSVKHAFSQQQENSSVAKVYVEETTQTAPEPLDFLYILIWLSRCLKGQVGHVALLGVSQNDYNYISWFAGKILKKLIKKQPGVASKEFQEDLKAEGRAPDKTYLYKTSNMAALVKYWKDTKNTKYHLRSNNCCSIVYEALRIAGAPEYIPSRNLMSLVFYYLAFWRPTDFNEYCTQNFQPIDYTEFLQLNPRLNVREQTYTNNHKFVKVVFKSIIFIYNILYFS